MDLESSSYHFQHFDTTKECDEFLFNNRQLILAYKCCEGRGIALFKPPTHILIKKSTLEGTPLPVVTHGTCDICFTEDKSLYSTCTNCKQPFCLDCLRQVKSKSCPYCRGELNLRDING